MMILCIAKLLNINGKHQQIESKAPGHVYQCSCVSVSGDRLSLVARMGHYFRRQPHTRQYHEARKEIQKIERTPVMHQVQN